MGVMIELGNGKTKYYSNVIDFLEDTEDGMQKIIAENKGSYVNPKTLELSTADEDEFEDELFLDVPLE